MLMLMLMNFLVLVLLLVAVSVVGQSAAVYPYVMTVMTYNVWNFNDGARWCSDRRDLVADVIRKAAPDIVGFQEIRDDFDNPKTTNQLYDLAVLLPGYELKWNPSNYYTVDGKGVEEGLGVFSKLKIAKTSVHSLPKGSVDQNNRIIMHVELNTPIGLVDFFNCHWTYDEKFQPEQAADTLNYTTLSQPLTVQQLLVGDLNIFPDEKYNDIPHPMKFLYDGGFVDTWTLAHPNDTGYTFSTLPSKGGKINRADRVLMRGQHWEILSIELLGGTPNEDNVYPSDHFCIVAKILFKDPNGPSTTSAPSTESIEAESSSEQRVSGGNVATLFFASVVVMGILIIAAVLIYRSVRRSTTTPAPFHFRSLPVE